MRSRDSIYFQICSRNQERKISCSNAGPLPKPLCEAGRRTRGCVTRDCVTRGDVDEGEDEGASSLQGGVSVLVVLVPLLLLLLLRTLPHCTLVVDDGDDVDDHSGR